MACEGGYGPTGRFTAAGLRLGQGDRDGLLTPPPAPCGRLQQPSQLRPASLKRPANRVSPPASLSRLRSSPRPRPSPGLLPESRRAPSVSIGRGTRSWLLALSWPADSPPLCTGPTPRSPRSALRSCHSDPWRLPDLGDRKLTRRRGGYGA